jgi:hypothetical protein
MKMERSLSFLLACLFLGIAVATTDSYNAVQEKVPMVRVRRGLIKANELHHLSAEFGEGGLRFLEDAEMMGEDMSMSMAMSMSMSMDMGMGMGMDMSLSYVEPSKKGKSRR